MVPVSSKIVGRSSSSGVRAEPVSAAWVGFYKFVGGQGGFWGWRPSARFATAPPDYYERQSIILGWCWEVDRVVRLLLRKGACRSDVLYGIPSPSGILMGTFLKGHLGHWSWGDTLPGCAKGGCCPSRVMHLDPRGAPPGDLGGSQGTPQRTPFVQVNHTENSQDTSQRQRPPQGTPWGAVWGTVGILF